MSLKKLQIDVTIVCNSSAASCFRKAAYARDPAQFHTERLDMEVCPMIENETVNRAIDYILNNMGRKLTIDEVAEYCHFSRYYFSRLFKAETGESVYSFIKRAKMEQSAFRLKTEPERTITDIGYDYGYTPSNYSSVFKQHHNESPADFRRGIIERSLNHPLNTNAPLTRETKEECDKHISIETIDDIFVLYERRIGNYYDLGADWNAFMQRYADYLEKDTLLIERTFDDPSITNADACIYDICMSVKRDCALENTCTIPGGKFAVYRFDGVAQEIYAAYQSLFTVWEPQSRHEVDDRYGFDIYREINCDTGHMTIDIYLPIK